MGDLRIGKQSRGGYNVELNIPKPLESEHEGLHSKLVKATKEGGRLGEAAQAVARILHSHFLKEERYALQPLGLLPLLAQGAVEPEMAGVLEVIEGLKRELPQMLREHKEIVRALNELGEAARDENKPEYVEFAQNLTLHAQMEEEVLYPAALLIGEYIKLRLGGRGGNEEIK